MPGEFKENLRTRNSVTDYLGVKMKFLVSLLSLGLMISAQAEDVKMEKVFTPEAIISGKAFLEKSNQSPEAKGTIIAKTMEASNEGFKAETSDWRNCNIGNNN